MLMQNITFSKNKVSLCYDSKCVNLKGDIANVVTLGLALFVIVGSISTLLESSK